VRKLSGRGGLASLTAKYLFKNATKALDPAGNGYTLRQLKPGAGG
jgi:hypothetical protein